MKLKEMGIYEKYKKHITLAIFVLFTAIMLLIMHPDWF